MNNYIKYYLRSLLYSISVLFTSTSVIQIFLTELGVDSIPIGIFTSLLSVVNVVTNVVFSASADRCKRVKRAISLFCLPIGCCFFLLIPLCLLQGLSVMTAFLLIAMICLVQMLFISLYTTLEYKLPYSIIDVSDYGRFASINGMICGIGSTICGYILSEMLGRFPYYKVLAVGFTVGGVCMLLASVINGKLDDSIGKQHNATGNEQTAASGILSGFLKMWDEPNFRRLILPNLFRGFHMGMLSVAAVIAIACDFQMETASRLVTISFLGSIFGSLVYMKACTYIESRKLCLFGSMIACIGIWMPFCSDNVFLFLYFVTVLGKIIVDYAVPSQVYKNIPYDIACLYQTWRLIITTAGSVLAAGVSGFFINHNLIFVYLLIASVLQLISGICYAQWKGNGNNQSNAKEDKFS